MVNFITENSPTAQHSASSWPGEKVTRTFNQILTDRGEAIAQLLEGKTKGSEVRAIVQTCQSQLSTADAKDLAAVCREMMRLNPVIFAFEEDSELTSSCEVIAVFIKHTFSGRGTEPLAKRFLTYLACTAHQHGDQPQRVLEKIVRLWRKKKILLQAWARAFAAEKTVRLLLAKNSGQWRSVSALLQEAVAHTQSVRRLVGLQPSVTDVCETQDKGDIAKLTSYCLLFIEAHRTGLSFNCETLAVFLELYYLEPGPSGPKRRKLFNRFLKQQLQQLPDTNERNRLQQVFDRITALWYPAALRTALAAQQAERVLQELLEEQTWQRHKDSRLLRQALEFLSSVQTIRAAELAEQINEIASIRAALPPPAPVPAAALLAQSPENPSSASPDERGQAARVGQREQRQKEVLVIRPTGLQDLFPSFVSAVWIFFAQKIRPKQIAARTE